MSLLAALQKRRAQLQATTTIVTTATGDRYIENNTTCATPVKLEERTYGFVVDTKPDTVPACILHDFLYLGSQDAVTTENITSYKITHILSVGVETPAVPSLTVHTKFLPCLDLPEAALFEGVTTAANAYIDAAQALGGRVLVHCNAGVSRAASIVIAYLMMTQYMSFEQAYALVKSKRQCIQPNAGFMKQLKSYNSAAEVLK